MTGTAAGDLGLPGGPETRGLGHGILAAQRRETRYGVSYYLFTYLALHCLSAPASKDPSSDGDAESRGFIARMAPHLLSSAAANRPSTRLTLSSAVCFLSVLPRSISISTDIISCEARMQKTHLLPTLMDD